MKKSGSRPAVTFGILQKRILTMDRTGLRRVGKYLGTGYKSLSSSEKAVLIERIKTQLELDDARRRAEKAPKPPPRPRVRKSAKRTPEQLTQIQSPINASLPELTHVSRPQRFTQTRNRIYRAITPMNFYEIADSIGRIKKSTPEKRFLPDEENWLLQYVRAKMESFPLEERNRALQLWVRSYEHGRGRRGTVPPEVLANVRAFFQMGNP